MVELLNEAIPDEGSLLQEERSNQHLAIQTAKYRNHADPRREGI
jgi:hypothetical protein